MISVLKINMLIPLQHHTITSNIPRIVGSILTVTRLPTKPELTPKQGFGSSTKTSLQENNKNVHTELHLKEPRLLEMRCRAPIPSITLLVNIKTS